MERNFALPLQSWTNDIVNCTKEATQDSPDTLSDTDEENFPNNSEHAIGNDNKKLC